MGGLSLAGARAREVDHSTNVQRGTGQGQQAGILLESVTRAAYAGVGEPPSGRIGVSRPGAGVAHHLRRGLPMRKVLLRVVPALVVLGAVGTVAMHQASAQVKDKD